jgi:hypothetical protein
MAIMAAAMALATEELSEALLTAALLPAELEADELKAMLTAKELTAALTTAMLTAVALSAAMAMDELTAVLTAVELTAVLLMAELQAELQAAVLHTAVLEAELLEAVLEAELQKAALTAAPLTAKEELPELTVTMVEALALQKAMEAELSDLVRAELTTVEVGDCRSLHRVAHHLNKRTSVPDCYEPSGSAPCLVQRCTVLYCAGRQRRRQRQKPEEPVVMAAAMAVPGATVTRVHSKFLSPTISKLSLIVSNRATKCGVCCRKCGLSRLKAYRITVWRWCNEVQVAGELTAALTAEEQTAVATVEAELSGLAVLQLTELKAMVALAWPELVEAEAMPTKAMLMQLGAMEAELPS